MLVHHFVQHKAQNIAVCQFQLLHCDLCLRIGRSSIVHYHDHASDRISHASHIRYHVDRCAVNEDYVILFFQLIQQLCHLLRSQQFRRVRRNCAGGQQIQRTSDILMQCLIQQAGVGDDIRKPELIGNLKILMLYRFAHVSVNQQHCLISFRNCRCQVGNSYGFSLVRTGTRHSNDFILAGGHQEIQGGAERFICFQNAERQIGVVIDQLPLSVCRSATVFLFDLAANALNLADHRLLEVFA